MSSLKSYIAAIGIYNENTTEQITLKEISVTAKDKYEAHKNALLKCNQSEQQIVLRIIDPASRKVLFDFQKGF